MRSYAPKIDSVLKENYCSRRLKTFLYFINQNLFRVATHLSLSVFLPMSALSVILGRVKCAVVLIQQELLRNTKTCLIKKSKKNI